MALPGKILILKMLLLKGNIKFGEWLRTFIWKPSNKVWSWFIQDMWHKHNKQDDNNLSSLSVDASSAFSVRLVIIWGNLKDRVLKTWNVILLSCENLIFFPFKPISEWRFHLTHKSVNKTFKCTPLKTNKTLKMYISKNWQFLLIFYQ